MNISIVESEPIQKFKRKDFDKNKIYRLSKDGQFAICFYGNWKYMSVNGNQINIENLDDCWNDGEYPEFHGEIRLTSG